MEVLETAGPATRGRRSYQGDEIVEKYVEVHVDEQRFQGVPRAVFRGRVEMPMDQLDYAGVRKFSPGKTVLLGIGGAAACCSP